jgi:hypothetical protein
LSKSENEQLPWDHFSEQIDWSKVDATFRENCREDLDEEVARRAIVEAASRWVPIDYAGLTIEGIETRKEFPIKGTGMNVKMYIDILARCRKDGITPYKKYAGQLLVIDWKTTGGRVFQTEKGSPTEFVARERGTLSPEWKSRYADSWQHKIYARGTGAVLAEYRGISLLREYGAMVMEIAPDNNEVVDRYVKGVYAAYSGWRGEELPVWPQRMPKSCGLYGRTCEFKEDCILDIMPKGLPPEKDFSYSLLENIMECPEKARRQMLHEEADKGTDAAAIGNAIHAGLAEIYSQVFKVPVEGRKK